MAMIESRTYSSKSERLRQHLLEEMAAGRLSASEPLPSENALAASFGVCRNTVRRAFGELERAGIIRRIRGKGTFLRSGPMRLTVSSQQPTRLQPTESGPLAVSSQQMQAYALLLPEVRRSLYPSLIRGFGRAAAESTRPRQVLVCQTENDIYRQADIVLQMLDRHVAGVALVPTTVAPTPAYHVSQLQAAGVAVVLCHRPVVGAAAPCVSWDWHEVGRLAAKALLERGHRRIAFVSSSRYAVPEAYEAGLRAGL
ncbi:MAG TPA: GntR family transcriptional regulator, partial [Tepidisphaeraceae bacterium]|nr:GntR family transcriptional regulator [Tepidisphaeraceae bacterium]